MIRVIKTVLLALTLVASGHPSRSHAQGAGQQGRIDIFDAHLHYSQEPAPFYQLDEAIEIFRRNGITGILANSRPNTGTYQLVNAKAQGLWVVPFLRPYRTRSDIQTWFNDEGIYDLVLDEYKRGYYRGIGEFHIYGKSAASEITRKIVNFAVEKNLYLHAHADEEALLILLSHNPKAKIIWAHTGFSTSPARVNELLARYPTLWGELSYRSDITGNGGEISGEWRDLFARHSDRFLLGSDTWINERWSSYDAIMKTYRDWLVQLPPDQAKRIASGNAERLFGPRKTE